MTTNAWIARCIVIILSYAVISGCQTLAVTKPRATLENEGAVLVYLQPLPQEADRLTFSLEEITAVREDGAEVPLALSVRDFSRSGMKRQRFVAEGRLPEGAYSGLFFKIRSASLKTEEGETTLQVPEAPVRKDFLFKVERKKALVLSLSLQPAELITAGTRFTPAWALAIPPRPLIGLSGYVADYDFNAVTVFDKMRQEVAGVIPTGDGPRGMAVDKTRNRLYVALSNDDAVEVVDIAEGAVLTRIRLAQGDAPGELALTPDGQVLLAVNTGSDSVSFIDPTAQVELSRVSVGRRPRSIILEKTGRKAYVFNGLSNSISIIDIATKTVVPNIAIETGPEPIRGQFNRAGDRLYVAHANYPYLFVVDPFSGAVLRRQFVGQGITSLKVDTMTDLLYIGKNNDTSIGIYDPLTFSAVEYLSTGGTVDYMDIDGEGNNLYLVISEKKKIMIVNLISKNVADIDVIDHPAWVTMMGER